MKTKRRRMPLLALLALSAWPMLRVYQRPAPPMPRAANAATSPSTLVVDLRDDTTQADIHDLETQLGIDLRPNSVVFASNKLMRATVTAGQRAKIIDALQEDARVETVEPEARYSLPEPALSGVAQGENGTMQAASKRGWTPNDPRFGEQWNFQMVGAQEAWTRSHGKGVIVAVIDTGITTRDAPTRKRAKDFAKTRFAPGYNFIEDNDNPYDDLAHGTHVGGTIAESTNNGEGVAGLAFEATLMPLKVFGLEGFGTSEDIADAVRFATDHGAKVINMSLGGYYPSEVMRDAIIHAKQHGVVVVCAAGNGFGEPVSYPAAFPECLAVSSVGPSGDTAFYSSFGPQVALSAPGGDMKNGPDGGVLQNTIWPEEFGGRGDDYYHFQGTSMAAPHVAAVAALLMAQGAHDPDRVRDLIVRGAVPREPVLEHGAGVLSAANSTGILARQNILGGLKKWLFVIWAALLMLLSPPLALWERRRDWSYQLPLVGALWLGLFLSDWMMNRVGADSAWNFIWFGAALPLLLFWQWPSKRGLSSAALWACGIGISLITPLIGAAAPFTPSTYGLSVLPWQIINALVAFGLAGAAWLRVMAKE